MDARKEYNMLFSLNAQVGPGYAKAFKSAQDEIANVQKEIVALNKTQGDIKAYQKQQAAVDATEKKLARLKTQYANIEEELKKTGNESSDLKNKLLDKQQRIEKTENALSAYREKLQRTGEALREAGIDTNDFAKGTAELGAKLNELKEKQGAAADEAARLGSAAAQSFDIMQQAIATAGVAVALKEIAGYFKGSAEASMEFETAMTGVAKTTDLTTSEFAAMSAEIARMSTEIPATTTELAAIAETAGQLGIAKNSLLDFTEIMAMLGTATNMTSDEAATMLAQFASITGMDPSQYSNLGSSVVALGNNYATTEKNIADMGQSIAAAGAIAGMSEADIIGVSAAVTSLGITAQAGGTSMMKLISDINSAVSSGEGLEDWAKVAGASADEFARAWRDDAAGALDMFVRGLNAAYESGRDVYGMLDELGVSETRMVTMTTSLAKAGDRLTDTLSDSNAAWAANTALSTEAEKRYATTQSQLTLLQNAYGNLNVAVGDVFTPTLRELYGAGADVLGEIEEFVVKHPEVVKGVTAFVGVVGLATGALSAYTLAARAARAISAAFMVSTGVALGPVMAVVGGVAALTAGVIALSEASKSWVDESWQLTATSRAQENELRDLNAEYERLTAARGEDNKEAYQLQGQIASLTREYKYGKQTLAEYRAEQERVVSDYAKEAASHKEALQAIEDQRRESMSLISELQSLMFSGAAEIDEHLALAVIDELNRALPELAVSYDTAAKASSEYFDALRAGATAQAAELDVEERRKQLAELTGKQGGFGEDMAEAERNAKLAREEYDAMVKAIMGTPFADGFMHDTSGEFGAARKGMEEQASLFEEAKALYEENSAAIEALKEELAAYREEQDRAAESGENIADVIGSIDAEMRALADAYKETYDAALESIGGQYDLWDRADKAVAISAGTINSALESQISYWREYNADLAELGERTGNIEGLQEVIASFADGSKESVNAIAGMAGASDKELEAMVKNWRALHTAQQDAAGGLASMETDFAATMQGLREELETFVAETNLSDEARKNGMLAAEGFARGVEDMLPEVRAAFKEMKRVSEDALRTAYKINSPSKVMWELGEFAVAGFTGGVAAMKPAVADVMADTAGAGIEALSAPSASRGDSFTITVSPQYTVTGKESADDLRSVFAENNENLRELVEDVLRRRNIDAARRAYN
jgi:TP901 family phage tail tape measure protein